MFETADPDLMTTTPDHTDGLNLSAAAKWAVQAYEAADTGTLRWPSPMEPAQIMWELLTGMNGEDARNYASQVADAPTPVHAYVPEF